MGYGIFLALALSLWETGPADGISPFEVPDYIPVGGRPSSVIAGDLNGDGAKDLIVANPGRLSSDGRRMERGGISVLLGNGDGTFRNEMRFHAGDAPVAVCVDDFDGDGVPDLAATNDGESSLESPEILLRSRVSVRLGKGDGTFREERTFGAGGTSIMSGDFDRNGTRDLVVLSRWMWIFPGNGDGTFQEGVGFRAGGDPRSFVVADVDGDGIEDIAMTNGFPPGVSLLLGNGDGTFSAREFRPMSDEPGPLTVGDFDGNGALDLAVAYTRSEEVFLHLNGGEGTFRTGMVFSVGRLPRALSTGDLNGDGFQDLVVANGESADVSVLLGNGDGTFQEQTCFGVGRSPWALCVEDLDGDRMQDLVVANRGEDDVCVLFGNGDGTFRGPRSFAKKGAPIGAGDFDRDGNVDLALTEGVLLGRGDGTFGEELEFGREYAPEYSGAVGDLDGDGMEDIVVAYGPGMHAIWGHLSIRLSNGDGTFAGRRGPEVGSYPWSLVTGDFDGDGNRDVVVSNVDPPEVSLFLGNGDGSFREEISLGTTELSGPYPAVGDFDGDGKDDLVVTSDETFVLLSTEEGQARRSVLPQGFGAFSVAAGDLNGDSVDDLVISGFRSDREAVLLGRGDGSFEEPMYLDLFPEWTFLKLADLDGDGKGDLIGWRSLRVSVFIGNGDGTFREPIVLTIGGGAGGIVPGDFNGDGRQDLAVGSGWARVLVFLNIRGEITPTAVPSDPNVSSVPSSAYELFQNCPNPFNSETTIRYALPEPGHVRLVVYNILGWKIRTLVDGDKTAGLHSVIWDGSDDDDEPVASGVYSYRLTVDGGWTDTGKAVLLR